MARIDSILAIALQQGCDELRVATGAEPRMFARGTPKRLHLPATGPDVLRDLLGEIVTPEREGELAKRGRIEVKYASEGGTTFDVTLALKPDGLEARFRKSGGAPALSVVPAVDVMAAHAPAPAPTTGTHHAVASGAPMAEPLYVPPPPSVRLPPTTEPQAAWALGADGAALFGRAAVTGASDLHLRDGEAPVTRIDGKLHRADDEPPVDVRALLGLDAGAVHALERGVALDRSVTLPTGGRARVHLYRSAEGLAAAVRFLPNGVPSVGALNAGVPLDDLVTLPHGLVLVCGSTGSGKSTTLAALAQAALARRSIAVVTLENPIEHRLQPGDRSIVRQREVGRDVPDFTSGLRDALREDPDLIVVGEMRDPETIALALTAAETGHLVLATMHSGSTSSAIERIVDAYPAARQQQIRTQLADVLRVVMAQRLLPRARGDGRTLAVELLRVTHAVASLIREGKAYQLPSLVQSGKKEGMVPLERSLADRVATGEVKFEDARAAANDEELFRRYVGAGRGGAT